MPTRFNTNSKSSFGQVPLPSGYEKTSGEADLTIPSCGIEDVDTAIFNLFEKEIVPEVGKLNDLKKVPIVFASGEKWAMLKRGRPLRDRNNTLILPLITIVRSEVTQATADDVVGRGINQQVGEFVIRRKLDKSDRDYQNLINKYLLLNQRNVAVRPVDPQVPDQMTSTRKMGSLTSSNSGKDTAWLSPNLQNNIYETIVVPTPQFYTVKYQVTIWTQYTQHSNQIIEKIISSLLPQGQSWRIDTAKGYWFVAKIDDGGMTTESSFEDMSQTERFIKNVISISVPAYFFASSAPGVPVPVKRYVSSPIISFETSSGDVGEGTEDPDSKYMLGSDDPTLPMSNSANKRRDQRETGVYYVSDAVEGVAAIGDSLDPSDPAATTLRRGYTIRVTSKNAKGETTYTGAQLDKLSINMTDDIP